MQAYAALRLSPTGIVPADAARLGIIIPAAPVPDAADPDMGANPDIPASRC